MKALIAYPPARTAPLARAAFARIRERIASESIEAVTKAMRGGDDVLRVINRTVVDPATTDAAGNAAELMQSAYGDFLAWLAPGSAAARLMPMGLNFPMVRADMKAPGRDTAPAALPWVGESMPIPVRSMTLLGITLTPRKIAGISIISREVAKYGGEAVITTMLREDGAKGLDAGYFSTATGDSVTHPGLLAGVSAIAGYGGGDQIAFETDIAALLAIVAPNGSGNLVIVTGQLRAALIALRFPDFKIPVYASPAVADTRVIMVDAGALVHSFGDFDIDIANSAAVHMEDTTPEPISSDGDPPAAAPVRSLLQTDSLGVRILGDVAFAGRKANVAAYVDNPTW